MTTCGSHLAAARVAAALLAAVIGAGSVALAGGSLVDGRVVPLPGSAHAAACDSGSTPPA